MVAVNLGRAELALWRDPTVFVVIPGLVAAPRRSARAGVVVQFEGDEWPTAFRGQSRSGSFDMVARFRGGASADALRLVQLIDELAPAGADSRLQLRTHWQSPTVIPPDIEAFVDERGTVAVQVFEVTETVVQGSAVDVTFTATIVQHSVEV